MPRSIQSVSPYLFEAFSTPDLLLKGFQEAQARNDVYDFDTIVGTDLSGTVVVPTLARSLHKKWAIVRKHNDGSHASLGSDPKMTILEGELGERWLFVDDQVDSGATLARVRDSVDKFVMLHNTDNDYHFYTTYVGTYQYNTQIFTRPFRYPERLFRYPESF